MIHKGLERLMTQWMVGNCNEILRRENPDTDHLDDDEDDREQECTRMNIFVIPEDFRKDQYILKPLFSQLFKRLGASNPKVNSLSRSTARRHRGGPQKADKLAEIVNDQQRYDGHLHIMCGPRRCFGYGVQRLNQIEAEFHGRCVFLAENAWEESRDLGAGCR